MVLTFPHVSYEIPLVKQGMKYETRTESLFKALITLS